MFFSIIFITKIFLIYESMVYLTDPAPEVCVIGPIHIERKYQTIPDPERHI
jgi:hypothetical protein